MFRKSFDFAKDILAKTKMDYWHHGLPRQRRTRLGRGSVIKMDYELLLLQNANADQWTCQYCRQPR